MACRELLVIWGVRHEMDRTATPRISVIVRDLRLAAEVRN